MQARVRPTGPRDADIMIIGETPSVSDERACKPFAGTSGDELTRMLHEAGLVRSECYITYLCKVRPPSNDITNFYLKNTPASRIPDAKLEQEIAATRLEIQRVNPRVIIILGDAALWGLTGERGIVKWRGSLLDYNDGQVRARLIPTYAPSAIMRKWDWRFIAVHDLSTAKREAETITPVPEYNFLIRPSFSGAMEALNNLGRTLDRGPLDVAIDIETRSRHIACIGFGWSALDAFCIPLMCTERDDGYWTEAEELALILKMSDVMLHPNIRILGQNFIYDMQYIAKHWGIVPLPAIDTMLYHAVCYPGLPKGLDFLSSIYCAFHRYWKDESKNWDPKLGEEQLWIYNCKDCVTTWESAQALKEQTTRLDLQFPADFEMSLIEPVFYMMLRGVNIDLNRRSSMMWELTDAAQEREAWFESLDITGGVSLVKSKNAKPWYRSPTQQQKLFYTVYRLAPIRNRKTGRPSADDDALSQIAKVEPLFAPICDMLTEYRSIGVFLSTFIQAPLDHDGRMRCSYNPVGTETFRFNSSEDAFGYGTNLQNIPVGG